MANLFEAYKRRLAVADEWYAKKHNGESLTESKKLVVAKCLENCNKLLNEAFENSAGTQRSAMGDYKKFCLNLVTTALPNLISQDLVIVHPMSSFSGYVTYVQYTTGSTKGSYAGGPDADVLNDPFHLGSFKEKADGSGLDTNYTAHTVCEAKKGANAEKYTETLRWTTVVPGTVELLATVGGVTTKYTDDGNGKFIKAGEVTATVGSSINYETGAIEFPASTFTPGTTVVVNYAYDNVTIPQNDLPIVNARIKSIPLIAKARRIAIYYSQIAAFQAKTDYGLDLGQQLAEKAVGQLRYRICTLAA